MREKASLFVPVAIVILAVIGCSVDPPSIKKLIVSRVKLIRLNSTKFQSNETIYVKYEIAHKGHHDDLTVKSFMTAEEDADGLEKGGVFPGSENTMEFRGGDNIGTFELSHPDRFPLGKYSITVELFDKDGKKLDSKTAQIEIVNVIE